MFAFIALCSASQTLPPGYQHGRRFRDTHHYLTYKRYQEQLKQKKPERVANSKASQIVAKARSKIGCPYVWGAAGPNSFDCSGLVQWVHKQCGISTPRVAKDIQRGGKSGSGQAGDVICFNVPATHVGICSGNGKYIHAPQTGELVKEATIRSGRTITYRRYW